MPSLHSNKRKRLYITLLLAFPPLSSAFSPVDNGKTNKKQRAATVAIAAGLSSLNDGHSISSGSRVHVQSHRHGSGRGRHTSLRSSLSSSSGQDVVVGSSNNSHVDSSSSSMNDFAQRMHLHNLEQSSSHSHANSNLHNSHDDDSSTLSISQDSTTTTTTSTQAQARRHFLSTMLATTTSALLTTTSTPTKASAYQQAYPIELTSTPYGTTETSANSLSKLQQERLSNKKARVAQTQDELRNDPLGLQQVLNNSRALGLTVGGATLWGLALWLVSGSRSNPLVNPVANLLYDAQEEQWLRDRNEGYFGELPLGLMIILSALFVCLGILFDRAVYFLAEGDAAVSLQLAGVSVIGGAVWEVGRLAAKEKAPTREDYERDVVLYREFDEFATKRLIVGKGSCHRSEVIAAFRRYNPKYRVAESEEYPLADIEIERILRQWNRQFGSRSEMSSAGFFAGISIDGAADAFAPR